MDTKTILNEASGRMQKAIDHLEEELLNVRAGKASPNALNGIMVDYFGSQVPVSGAASVTVPDAKTIFSTVSIRRQQSLFCFAIYGVIFRILIPYSRLLQFPDTN